MLSTNIKLNKQLLREEKNIKNRKISILCYLFFHTTCKHNVYININTLCSELNLSTSSHNSQNSQSLIKQTISELIQENIIHLHNNKDILTCDNRELLLFTFNDYNQYIAPQYHYVSLSLGEYDKLLKCKGGFYRAFNTYCHIKSYICMDDKCLHICYPSIPTLCKKLQCTEKFLVSTLKALCEQKLLYIYHFSGNDIIETSYGIIQLVFSLEKYTKKQILNEFMA